LKLDFFYRHFIYLRAANVFELIAEARAAGRSVVTGPSR
jgi:hypothetical protein